jgi:hypothetical protein
MPASARVAAKQTTAEFSAHIVTSSTTIAQMRRRAGWALLHTECKPTTVSNFPLVTRITGGDETG